MHKTEKIGIDGLLTVEDAARFLAVSRATIYRLIERGSIVRVKLGPNARICRRSIINFIESQAS